MISELKTACFGELALDNGETLRDVEVAYETYGTLNSRKSNAILIVHAFTGDAHVTGVDHDEAYAGGGVSVWSAQVKAFDTDRYYVICSNVLGAAGGLRGRASIDPAPGGPYGMSFPVITIGDMVRLQRLLVESLGISKLLAVSGGSMGGMQALEWAVAFPESVYACIPIATTGRHTAQQIAFNEVGRQAIVADPDFQGGSYYESKPPARGLAVARMVGHITYMSDESMREKFGRRLRGRESQLRLRRGF